jgi:hypothetical protein
MPEPEKIIEKPTMREAAVDAGKESKPSETKVEPKKTDEKPEVKVEETKPGEKVVVKDDKNIKKSVEGEGETPEGEAPPTTDEKPDKDQSPATEESKTDSASSFDPKKLPEALKPVYKQMQGDYTRKTQALAKEKEIYQKVQRYVPLLNKVLSDPKLLNQVLGIDPKTGKATEPTATEIPTDPKEFTKYVADNATKTIRAEIAEKERIRASQEANMRDINEAEKLDSRLNDDPDFQNIIIGMVTQNPDYIGRKVNAVQATKQAIEIYDSHISTLIKANDDKRKQAAGKKKHVISEGQTGGETVASETKSPDMREIAKQEGFIT